MNTEYLLREVKQANEIQITQRMLFDMTDFKTSREVASMESLALTLSGHQPIKDYRFDISKLETWCKENSLRFYLDEREHILHLKCE